MKGILNRSYHFLFTIVGDKYMASEEKQEKAKALFESRFMSIILMLTLVVMGALFIVIIWLLFNQEIALNVLMYISIGAGSGAILTISSLFIFLKLEKNFDRNILFVFTMGVLAISLVLSLILKYSVNDPTLGNWLFIYTSSVGLGVTTGIAISYLLLAMFKSKLVEHRKIEKDSEESANEEEQQ